MKYLLCILSVSTMLLSSCNSNSTTGTNNNNNGGTNNTAANTMTVTIDGTNYTMVASGGKGASGGVTVTSIAGADATGKGVGFSLTNITTAGPYSFGYSVGAAGLTGAILTYTYTVGSDNIVYSSSTVPGVTSGTLTIQELTATSCKATFTGTVTKIQGTAGANTVSITNGSVNATIY
ncbi:MAG: hypothetical protein WCH46_09335 [bacterium]